MNPENTTAIPNTILISACETEISFLAKGSQVGVSWHVPDQIAVVPSHVNVTLIKRCQNKTNQPPNCNKEIYSALVDGLTRFHKFDSLNEVGLYYFWVQICFDEHCLYPRQSNGFVVESDSFDPKITECTIDNNLDCTELEVKWKVGNLDSIFYRWGIFKDNKAQNNLTEMFIFHPVKQQENYLVKTCIRLPVYIHSKLFACIQEFLISGLWKTVCKKVETVSHPNGFSTNIVYDVDMNSPDVIKLLKLLHSSYIGDEISTLHSNELDFAQPTISLGAMIIGRSGLNTSWFLMKTPRIPLSCYGESDCIDTNTTMEGFIKFKIPLVSDNVYYICAVSTMNSSVAKIQDDLNACSDGVIIDSSRPVAGDVEIKNKNGYITYGKEMIVSWIGFSDSLLYTDLGYGNGIKEYQYALVYPKALLSVKRKTGTYPKGRDIIPFTPVVYSTNIIIIRNLNLTGGFTYFVSIKGN
ncbi:hypothetical protein KUTeg_018833 [Tegillarca granosa]|uniref:Uncharacterized protein n=1 Tax=Tegillarca granosa TaxID=220873 RepID=A0ABQ9EAT5_TEGGR|nr:hypothetical protein KUTeg_018833 [Tegillarca granosa]